MSNLQIRRLIQLAPPDQPAIRWMSWVLLAAAVYNVVWGGLVVLFPYLLFDGLGMERPNYPELWQCVGMIVGVYGIGYGVAARDPLTHWPIVLVGLLGKILGPIGFVEAVWRGAFPLAFGFNILTNDLIWWVPFGLILHRAWRQAAGD
jgi:small multidrug resistance pump